MTTDVRFEIFNNNNITHTNTHRVRAFPHKVKILIKQNGSTLRKTHQKRRQRNTSLRGAQHGKQEHKISYLRRFRVCSSTATPNNPIISYPFREWRQTTPPPPAAPRFNEQIFEAIIGSPGRVVHRTGGYLGPVGVEGQTHNLRRMPSIRVKKSPRLKTTNSTTAKERLGFQHVDKIT